MRLYLINPANPLVSLLQIKENRWNRYRVWKPLSLMTLASLSPPEWEVTIFDENLGIPDYASMPQPDLVGVTAFTSQACRAYDVAEEFRGRGVPVVMGGIHATMCLDEAAPHVDSVVTGEAESIWPEVLRDAKAGNLQKRYDGGLADLDNVPTARLDMLKGPYALGSIQTTRGCPLNCSFCSVSAFNGTRYRQRPIEDVVREFMTIPEKIVLMVDDNLIGTTSKHIDRAKSLFRALIKAKHRKRWMAQATVNMADDEELLSLAHQAGCRGVFIGFETHTSEGLVEIDKKFNLPKGRDFRASVQRIQKHNIQVVGSFILGLDVDRPGIGLEIAEAAEQYGVDLLNMLYLTPLPGTKLWEKMTSDDRIPLNQFPQDWSYFTLTYPVGRYANLSLEESFEEMKICNDHFFSLPRILGRIWGSLWRWRNPLATVFTNFSYRGNLKLDVKSYADFQRKFADRYTSPENQTPAS